MAERKRVPGLSLVLGFGKGPKGPKSEPGDEPESGSDELSPEAQAMSDLHDSLKGGDYQGAFEAFERAKSLCDKSYESEDESEDF